MSAEASLIRGKGPGLGDIKHRFAVSDVLRVAQYPDGSVRLQSQCLWSHGETGGLAWVDLPMVLVDETGQEIKV